MDPQPPAGAEGTVVRATDLDAERVGPAAQAVAGAEDHDRPTPAQACAAECVRVVPAGDAEGHDRPPVAEA